MWFIVPDDYYDKYWCYSCNKFLSVKPVKIHCNRQLTCGRCVKSDDVGVESMLKNFSNTALFKCVNRFDGCELLLTTNEVVAHETICKSKDYICPLCSSTTRIPTYCFIQHFRQNHRNNVLINPSFTIVLNHKLTNFIYLFKSEDRLFFIYINNDYVNDCITLNVMSLGSKISESNQMFRLNCGKKVIQTKIRPIASFGSEDKPFFISKSEFEEQSVLLVTLHVAIKPTVAQHFRRTSFVPEEQNTPDVTCQDNIPTVPKIETEEVPEVHFQPTKLEDLFKRNLDLEKDVLAMNTNLSLSKNFEIFLKGKKVIPYCYLCSEVFYGTEKGYLSTYFYEYYYNQTILHFVCVDCKPYCKIYGFNLISNDPRKPIGPIVPYEVFKDFLYQCSWGCGRSLAHSTLQGHEFLCLLQPEVNCPVRGCRFTGGLFQISVHFDGNHRTDTRSINFGSSIVERVYKSSGHDMYFWIKGYFVLIEINRFDINDGIHLGFCIHKTRVNFCSNVPENLKLITLFGSKIKIIVTRSDIKGQYWLPSKCREGVILSKANEDHSICSHITNIKTFINTKNI